MNIYKKIKDSHGTRMYLFGVKIYELRKESRENCTFLFGIKVLRKRSKGGVNVKVREQAEQKIRELAEKYKNNPPEQKHILCFDCLYNPQAEAIDAWTLFQYMQEKGIPSRYVILSTHPLYAKLKAQNKLDSILPVDNEFDLLVRYPEEIARSSHILFSFPFSCSRVFLEIPNIPFVFIEHGVTLLKPWCVRLYSTGGNSECNYILTPSRLTKELYDKMGIMQGRMLQCGMPRWDALAPFNPNKEKKNIFLFFTWRTTFMHDRTHLNTYTERIGTLLLHLQKLIEPHPQIELHIGLHPALILHNPQLKNSEHFAHAKIVSPHEISSMIRDADLFITDYSSVCFDLMYRNVPTIFYRFDTDLTYSRPEDNEDAASAASFDAQLYNSCYELTQALALVEKYINNHFMIEDEIRQKNDYIFWQRGENCHKLLELIEHLEN